MEELWNAATLGIAIILAWVFGARLQSFIDWTTEDWRPSAPTNMSKEDWDEIYDPSPRNKKGGKWIGILERYLFLGAFWLSQPIVIGVWLAFKLGTKWETWKDVTQVPGSIEDVDEISYLRSRSKWGSWLLNRFLIGTAANLLIAMVAYLLALGFVWGLQHWDMICPSNSPSSTFPYRFP